MTAAWRTSDPASANTPGNQAEPSRSPKVTPIAKARIKRLARTRPTAPSAANSSVSPDQPTTVKVLPSAQAKPLWLTSLIGIQRTSSILTALVTGATLTVYGWTMYAQSSWAESYQRLETLRHQEQQLKITNEVLKHKIAEQATHPDSGLVPLNSAEQIFLPSTPTPPRSLPSTTSRQPAPRSPLEQPLGY